MALDHKFILVSAAAHRPADYLSFIGAPNAIRLHDDLLDYMGDSLKWIPTLNAETNKRGYGFNLCGATAVLSEGAPAAIRIFRTWAQLFSLSPSDLNLTGSWTDVVGDPRAGHYSELRFTRRDVTSALEHLAADCARVAEPGSDYFLLHLGI